MNTQADVTLAEAKVKQAEQGLAAGLQKHRALEAQLETLEKKEASWVFQAEFAGNSEAAATLAATRTRLAETKTLLAASDGEVDQAKFALAAAQAQLESAITGALLFTHAKTERELVRAWLEYLGAQQAVAQSNQKIGRLDLELQPLANNLRTRLKPRMFDGTLALPFGEAAYQFDWLQKRLAKLDAELAKVQN